MFNCSHVLRRIEKLIVIIVTISVPSPLLTLPFLLYRRRFLCSYILSNYQTLKHTGVNHVVLPHLEIYGLTFNASPLLVSLWLQLLPINSYREASHLGTSVSRLAWPCRYYRVSFQRAAGQSHQCHSACLLLIKAFILERVRLGLRRGQDSMLLNTLQDQCISSCPLSISCRARW